MHEKRPDFRFMATGIGSVPFLDVEATCREMADMVPFMPFWPQFVKRSHVEDMSIQYSEGLPLLEVKAEERSLIIPKSDQRETGLVKFYEHYLADEVECFAMSREYAPGFYSLLELIADGEVECGPFIKGQIVGPLTFTAGIKDAKGKPILHDPELSDAMARGLSIKALWQVRKLERSGKRPIIFLDEPYLSGFGSAFSPIQRHEVVDMLRIVINYLRNNADVLTGIHCCGNTDGLWFWRQARILSTLMPLTIWIIFCCMRMILCDLSREGGLLHGGLSPPRISGGMSRLMSCFQGWERA